MPKNLLTVQEAARILKVSEKTLRRWEAKNYITPIRTSGKHRRYSLELLKSAKKNVSNLKRESYLAPLPVPEDFKVDQSPVIIHQKVSPVLTMPAKTLMKKVFVAYFAIVFLSLGTYGFLRFEGNRTNLSQNNDSILSTVSSPSDASNTQAVSGLSGTSQVLAATSFQNAEFNINIPAVLNSSVVMNSSVTINSDLTIAEDTFSDVTGDGLAIVGGALSTTLGTDVASAEITDGTISEVDLLSSNTPTASQYLTFNTTTGGFTWITPEVPTDEVGTNFFTDGGDTTYLTDTDEDFAIGGSDTSAPFFFDVSSGNLSVDDITINSIALDAVGSNNITSGSSLIGVFDEFSNSSSTTVQDVLDDLDAAIGGGSSKFTQDTGFVYLTNSTDSVTIGGTAELGKLAIDGDNDEVQFLVQGNGTQTTNLAVFENSSGTDLLTLNNSGNLTLTGNFVGNGNTTIGNTNTDTLTINAGTSGTGILFGDSSFANCTAIETVGGVLTCGTDAGAGGMTSFTLSGDSGSDQAISDANTLEVAGGTNGIDTVAGATDTITLNLDTTEIGSTTFGSGSGIVWTFDASAGTDPTITFGSDLVTIGNGLTITGTTTTNGALAANGQATIGDNGDTVVINSSDWDINATGDATGIGAITADGAVSFTPGSTSGVTFGLDTDSLFTLDSAVTNGDNLVVSPNNAGTGSTFTGTLTSSNLTADRTWTLQDGDGTIAFLTDIPTSDNYQYWTIDGDDATTEQIGSTQTLLVAGGTNGIDTDVSATDTITLNFDSTEVGTTTFGAGSGFTWTFDASAGTDATVAFGNDTASLTAGTITLAGNVDATNGLDVTTANLTVGGANFSVAVGSGDITSAGTITASTAETINGIDISAGTVTDIVNLTINTGGDVTIGAIGLNDVGSDNITSGASLLGVFDEFSNSSATTVQDVLDDFDSAIGSGASKFTQDTGFIYLTNTTDSVTVGGNTELAKLAVDGDSDQIQLLVQGNGTQTTNLVVFENSAGTDLLTLTNTGALTLTGDLAVNGGDITTTGDLTFDSGDEIVFADTDTYVIGGHAGNVAYNVISNAGGSPGSASVDADNDLYIQGTLEIDGVAVFDGGLSVSDLTCTDCLDFTELEDTLDLDANTNINADNDSSHFGLTITSDLSFADRTTDVLSITQANNATFNSSGNLIQLSNSDTLSNSAMLEVTQTAANGTGITVDMDGNGAMNGVGILIDSAVTGASGATSAYDMFKIIRTMSHGNAGAAYNENGNLVDISRTLLNNHASGSLTSSGDLVTISSTNTENAGSLTDTSSLLTLTQNCGTNVDCTGNVFELTNAGTGDSYDILMSNVSGTQTNGLLINRTGAGTTTNAINITETTGTITNGLNFGDNNLTLDINAVTDLTIGIGGSSELTLTGTSLSPSTAQGNTLGSTALEWEELFLGDDQGVTFGIDEDWTLAYDEATDDRLELITTKTLGMLFQSGIATGTAFNFIDNAISTGTVLQTESTSTSLTTAGDAFLGYFNWEPGSTTTATGDLFRINIGANGNVTNLFNVTNNGSSLFSVSESSVTSTLPLRVSDSGIAPVNQALVIFDQDENQDILTASASGVPKFVLDNSGKVYLGALDTETANTTATCWFDNTINGVTLKEITDCNGTPTDLAENFGTSDVSIEAGDVVMADGQAEVVSPRGLLTSKAYVKKSDSTYNSKILGVVSTAPNQVYGEDGLFDPSENPRPISLAGRVPTKVNLENGPILSGDSVTSSSTPGVAMKATGPGTIIGKALQDFNPTNPSEVGKIIVLMNVGYENPTPENSVSREEIESLLLITEQNQRLLEESQNWNTNTATASAEFSELVTDNLFVTGIAALNSLSITDSLILGNNLSFTNGNIDTLTTPLNIQGSGLQPLNFMAGKVSIDVDGNVVVQGDLKVLGTLEANNVTVSDSVAGNASIPAGTSDITIVNENIKTDSLIFVTPTTATKDTIYVKSQTEGQVIIGFDTPEVPTTSDIKFNWWIVGVSQ